jgi:hypothetical protein
MKKYIIYIFICIIFLLVSVSWYFSPILFNTIVSEQIQVSALENINVIVFSSVHLQKTYEFNEKDIIDNLIKIFDNIEVRRTLLSTKTFTFKPSMYNTYYLQLTSNSKSVSVDFMDKDYLIINNHIYKIVNKPNLKQISDIVRFP